MKNTHKYQIVYKNVTVLKLRERDFELKPELMATKLCGWAPDLLLIPEKYRDEFTENTTGIMDYVLPSLMPTAVIAFY